MAAVTGIITAVAGLGLTAYQMYEQDQAGKEASKAAEAAANRLKSIEEKNVYQQIQTPDISSLAFEKIAQSEAAGIEALKGMGAEGAAQVTGMVEGGRQAALGVAEKQAMLEHRTDLEKARVSQEIEGRRVDRESAIAYGEVTGANAAMEDSRQGMIDSTEGLMSGLGNLATGIGTATSLEAKAQRQAKKKGGPSPMYDSAYSDLYNAGLFDEQGGFLYSDEYLNTL